LESAAIREAKEETSLDVHLREQFHSYSDPDRDPRHHTVSTVFIATATALPRAADDAREARLFSMKHLPTPLVFDHGRIIADYLRYKQGTATVDIFSLQDLQR